MTNKQLQEQLRKFPDDVEVIIHVRAGGDRDEMYGIDGDEKNGYDVAYCSVQNSMPPIHHLYIGTK